MTQTRPCIHIRPFLSGLLDNRLGGAIGAYVHWHVARCPRCQAALDNLREIGARLSGLRRQADRLPDSRWAKLESAWAVVEKESGGT